MHCLATLFLVALSLPAQTTRIDCAPLRLSLPGPADGFAQVVVQGTHTYLHVIARVGVPFVSIVGATGSTQVKLNLLTWEVRGVPMVPLSAITVHFSPPRLPYEFPHEFWPDTGGALVQPGDTNCFGLGLATPALGLPIWPCDWQSNDALRNRDIVADATVLPRKVGHMPIVPWIGGQWAQAIFEVAR